MKAILILFLAVCALGEELVVTQAYTDYLKRHVTWEVVEYEDNVFRGWTVDEVMAILNQDEPEEAPKADVELVSDAELPSTLNWRELRADCIHPIRNQGSCGSCWAFSASSVVSDRCCLRVADHGWLSPQELVSCDRRNHGCHGGWEYTALDYVSQNGLIHDGCFPYVAADKPCPYKCADGKDWKDSHVCKCKHRVNCQGPEAMKACLQTGPVTAGMYVYKDFLSYKSGIYHWNRSGNRLGGHAIRCYGYSDNPEAHWMCANSWGTAWGESGFFRIGKGEVGIDTRNPSYCDPEA